MNLRCAPPSERPQLKREPLGATRNSMMLFMLVAAASFAGPSLCSIGELRESPGYKYRVGRIRAFVRQADVIARATAVGPVADDSGRATFVRFAVTERLRGPDTITSVVLEGRLTPHDDFNTEAVPYQIVRREGQHGDCYARQYRQGAEYLLLLHATGKELTAQWAPLAPVNEQIRGAADPWVRWVRDHL